MYFCLVAIPGPISLEIPFLRLPLGTYADMCWRVGNKGSREALRRGAVVDQEVSCSSLFPSDADWPWWYYVIGVVLTMFFGPCFIKGCYIGCCKPKTILNAGVYISFKIHIFVTSAFFSSHIFLPPFLLYF